MLQPALKLKPLTAQDFKAPSLYFLFEPVYGNPDLKPEKSIGWDLGFDQSLFQNKIIFGITYFNLGLTDMFGYDENYKEINIAKASSRGLEFYTTLNFFAKLIVNANYTYNKTLDEYNLSDDYNKSLIRRPENQVSVNLNYMINDAMNINSELKYVSGSFDKDFSTYPAQRVKLPDYALINISASYKIFYFLELTGRIENLFDKKYEEVLYYGTLGRSFYAGLNVNL